MRFCQVPKAPAPGSLAASLTGETCQATQRLRWPGSRGGAPVRVQGRPCVPCNGPADGAGFRGSAPADSGQRLECGGIQGMDVRACQGAEGAERLLGFTLIGHEAGSDALPCGADDRKLPAGISMKWPALFA